VQKDEDTMSGVVLEPRRAWVLDLVAEVIDRALAAGKTQEAGRILHRAADEFSERARAGGSVDVRALAQISEYALRLATVEAEPHWVRWVAENYTTHGAVPPATLRSAFIAAAQACPDSARVLAEFGRTLSAQASSLSSGDAALVETLEQLDRSQ
jgi:hypothetical protein